MSASSTLYPLGANVFATVKTVRGEVKINVHQFATPKNVKGGRLAPTRKGISLTLKQFLRLLKAEKHLAKEFNQQVASLETKNKTNTTCQCALLPDFTTLMEPQLQQAEVLTAADPETQ